MREANGRAVVMERSRDRTDEKRRLRTRADHQRLRAKGGARTDAGGDAGAECGDGDRVV